MFRVRPQGRRKKNPEYIPEHSNKICMIWLQLNCLSQTSWVQEFLNSVLQKSYEISIWPIKEVPVSYLTKRYSFNLKNKHT